MPKTNINSKGEPGLTAKAIRLLRRIEEQILAEPKRLNMHDWGTLYSKDAVEADKSLPPCGTVGCIAGWAFYLSKPREWKDLLKEAEAYGVSGVDAEVDATIALGLQQDQANRLFMFKGWFRYPYTSEGWPERFEEQYTKAKTARGRARAAARRIEHFIETNGAE